MGTDDERGDMDEAEENEPAKLDTALLEDAELDGELSGEATLDGELL